MRIRSKQFQEVIDGGCHREKTRGPPDINYHLSRRMEISKHVCYNLRMFLFLNELLRSNVKNRKKVKKHYDHGGKAHKESSSRKHNQKAPEDMSFIREKTYTLPITPERELRIRARTKKRKKRRNEKPVRLEVRKHTLLHQHPRLMTILLGHRS